MNEEKLDLILSEIIGMKQEISAARQDISGLKTDMVMVKTDVAGLKLHIENETDKHISILAENHVELMSKLNIAISVADKSKIYEMKVDLLAQDVRNLKEKLPAV